eukprot:Pgem_evm1s12474
MLTTPNINNVPDDGVFMNPNKYNTFNITQHNNYAKSLTYNDEDFDNNHVHKNYGNRLRYNNPIYSWLPFNWTFNYGNENSLLDSALRLTAAPGFGFA